LHAQGGTTVAAELCILPVLAVTVGTVHGMMDGSNGWFESMGIPTLSRIRFIIDLSKENYYLNCPI
jgi:hypothetical protein